MTDKEINLNIASTSAPQP